MPVLGETDGRNRGGSTFLSDTIPTMTGAASSADREEAGDQSLGDRKKQNFKAMTASPSSAEMAGQALVVGVTDSKWKNRAG